MQAFISNLTAATLLVHSMFGCCWHHAPAQRDASELGYAACSEHGHGTTGESGRSPVGPGKCNSECRGLCIYLPPQKIQIAAPQIVMPFDVAAAVPAIADCHFGSAFSGEQTCNGAKWKPSLRLHLAHQVLLI